MPISIHPSMLPPEVPTKNVRGQIPSMAGGTASSLIAVSIADKVIATNSDTSVFGTLATGQTQTITPNENAPYQGNLFRIWAAGKITTPTLNLLALTIKAKWGTTTLASVTSTALTSSLTDAYWEYNGRLIIRSVSGTPSASTAVFMGLMNVNGIWTGSMATSTPATINTTVASKIDLTMAFNGVPTTHSITTTAATIEILN